jgi:hypothetical protein
MRQLPSMTPSAAIVDSRVGRGVPPPPPPPPPRVSARVVGVAATAGAGAVATRALL